MCGMAHAGAHPAPPQHCERQEEHGAAVPEHETQMSAVWRPRTETCWTRLASNAVALLHCNIAVGVFYLFVRWQWRNPVTIKLVSA